MSVVTFDIEAVRDAQQQLARILEDARQQQNSIDWRRNSLATWRELTSPPPGPGGAGGQGPSLGDWRVQSWEQYGLSAIAQGCRDAAFALEELRRRAQAMLDRVREGHGGALADRIEREFGGLPSQCSRAIEHLLSVGDQLRMDRLDQLYPSAWGLIEELGAAASRLNDYIGAAEQFANLLQRMAQQEEAVKTTLESLVVTAIRDFYGLLPVAQKVAGEIERAHAVVQQVDDVVDRMANACQTVTQVLKATTIPEKLAPLMENISADLREWKMADKLPGLLDDVPAISRYVNAGVFLLDVASGNISDPRLFTAHLVGTVIQLEPHVAIASAIVTTVSLIDGGASWVTGKLASHTGQFQSDWSGISSDWGQASKNLNAGKFFDDFGALLIDGDPQQQFTDLGNVAKDTGSLAAGAVQTVVTLSATVDVGLLNGTDAVVNALPAPSFIKSGVHSATGALAGGISDAANFVAHPHFPPW